MDSDIDQCNDPFKVCSSMKYLYIEIDIHNYRSISGQGLTLKTTQNNSLRKGSVHF